MIIVYNPAFSGTAKKVSGALGGSRLVPYGTLHGLPMPDMRGAFHLAYPDYQPAHPAYRAVRRLFVAGKAEQRQLLSPFFPVPSFNAPYSGKVVTRPMQHTRGIGMNVCDLEDVDFGAVGYIAPLIERALELRVVFVRGEPVIVYQRRREDGNQNVPWNIAHGALASKVELDQAMKTYAGFFRDFERAYKIFPFDLVGIDIAIRDDGSYVLLEINFAPGTRAVDGIAEAIAAQITKGGMF